MQSSVGWMLLWVFIAGAAGGVVNALITDNGFIIPKREKVNESTSIYRPGYFGNVIIGAVAAVVSWGLYGPLSSFLIIGTPEALKANVSPEKIGLSLASLVGAVLVGIGGVRWLTNEVDKDLLRAAAAQAASAQPSARASEQMTLVSPAQVLSVARSIPPAP